MGRIKPVIAFFLTRSTLCRMYSHDMKRAALAFFLMGAALARLAGAQQTPGSLDWIKAAWEGAFADPAPMGTFVRFEITRLATMTPDEIAAERERIRAFPDHPRHTALDLELRLSANPDREVYSVWWMGPREWRINRDINSTILDRAVTKKHMWQYAADGVVFISTADRPPPNRDLLAGPQSDILNSLRLLLHSGLGDGHHLGVRPVRVSIDGDEWITECESRDGVIALEYRGRVEEEDVVILERRVVRSPLEQGIGAQTTFSKQREYSNGVRAHALVTELTPVGRPARTLRLLEIGTFDQRFFAEIARPPSPDRTDELRGNLRLRKIEDFRPEKMAGVRLGAGGLEEYPLKNPAGRQTLGGSWRPIGWLLLIGIVIVLAWIKVRRASL